jgi:hypothetical protein
MYIELVKNDVNNIGKSGKLNTMQSERDAVFFFLTSNPNIVIRSANKGSGIGILE